jgi:hypothetical protein
MAPCSKSGGSCVNAIVRKLWRSSAACSWSIHPFRKQPIAAAVLAALTATPGATPTEARHSDVWYFAHGYHRGPVKGFIKDEPTLKNSATAPVEAAKATPVIEADTPPLRIIPPIVNSQLRPPDWAGELHVSPALYRGRSASAGWQGRMKP